MLVIAVILVLLRSSLQDQCSRATQLLVSANRNQTGHWRTLIYWEQQTYQGPESDSRESGTMLLGINQLVQGCAGVETFSLQTELSTPPSWAGPGYGLVPGIGRYKFNATASTWQTARRTCSDEGGHLAVIRNKDQEEALKAMFERHPKIEKSTWENAAWLGFSDQHSEGDFITVLGESFSNIGYANWKPGRPDNKVYDGYKEDSDCGALWRQGSILDQPCSAKYAFICEQDLL